ncbi:multicomponent Na+:H+ antiporter subunit B [Halogranum gelatinilyticum]|uniref:Multicomponent Na+:H+ antiporter subunit B n=1 Tax=Halogranum gelatinilyticum TaxID=660521 RepID=A0A1G9QYQ9_9EURY|nr:MnhB domain-containing protein [Halogranum gelatinilyticum]SDM15727.1 multicomponent Na+:H+ antiporter subunit B [Halogranum gelatinilyticum]
MSRDPSTDGGSSVRTRPENSVFRTEDQVPYVESTIIMTTVRIVVPFILTLGLFVMFHGADSAGGGFQGGTIAGTVVLLLAFAYGIEPVRDWLAASRLLALIAVGLLTFLGIGFGSMLFGGAFLQYVAYPYSEASKYGIELVELGIGAVVAGIITGLFFLLAAGFETDEPMEDEP